MGKDHILIASKRLYVRTWRAGDWQPLYRVMSDSRVHTYTSEGPWTEEQTRDMIAWCMEHRLGWELGYFNCPLILRKDDLLIGRVGLNPFYEKSRIPEIEWTLDAAYWGQGYATEIGREILPYGFEQAGFDEIVGFAWPEHAASRRVMCKIDMSYTGDRQQDGRMLSFYSASKTTWDPQPGLCQ